MNLHFDSVAIVIDEDDDWVEAVPDGGAHFLGRHLEAPVSDESQDPPLLLIQSSRHAKNSANAPPNRPVLHLHFPPKTKHTERKRKESE